MWKKNHKKTCMESGLIGNHNFEPRYDNKYPQGFMQAVIEMAGDPRRYMEQTYVCDVCTWCGKTTKRP